MTDQNRMAWWEWPLAFGMLGLLGLVYLLAHGMALLRLLPVREGISDE